MKNEKLTWLNYVKTNHYLLSLLSLWPYVKVFDCHFSLSFHILVKHLSDAYSRVVFDTCPFLFWVQGLMSKPFEKKIIIKINERLVKWNHIKKVISWGQGCPSWILSLTMVDIVHYKNVSIKGGDQLL